MRALRSVWARLTGMFAGARADDELRAELEAHVEMETAEYVRRGMRPAEARRRALLASGGLEQAAEAVREQRGVPWLEDIAADVRYALRSLRRSPSFAVIVVLTLALGLGANTAIFSVVRGVLLKPLPHRDGDRLVYVRHSMDGPGGSNTSFSVPEVRDFRSGIRSLAGIAEYSPWSVVLQGEDGAVRINVGLVTGNYFEVMGLAPVVGRVTTPRDDGAGVPPVMVLSYEYWQTRFGGDPGVIGERLIVDGIPATVIGVLQPAPFYPQRVDALVNMVVSDHHLSATMVEGRTHRMTEVIARLAPGASLDQARSEFAAVYARMQRDHPDAYDAGSNPRVTVIPYHEVLGEQARLTLWLLMAAAAFVLLISVANAANLALMRGVRREHELVARAALGAGAGRLRRLLLAENLVLALLGAAVGWLIATSGLELLVSLAERYSPRASEIRLDAPVFGFMFGLSLSVAVLLSFLVSLPREGGFGSRILAGSQRTTAGVRKLRLQRALVVVQVAASVVLLAGAGLLTRTMMRLSDVNTGLTAEHVLTMQVPLLTPVQILSEPALEPLAKERYEQIRREIAALPGVGEVGIGSPGPLRSSTVRFQFRVEGRDVASGEAIPRAEYRTAGPQYFRAAGIPLLRGRAFSERDRPGAERVVIINETLARRLFAGEDAIGRRIAWSDDVLRFTPISGDWRTIVGVVADTRDGGLDAEPRAAVFMPFAQEPAIGGTIVIRGDENVAALAPAAARIVNRIAPAAPIENVMTVAQIKDRSVSPRRLNAALISSFGVLAVIIAAIGIAGLLAFSVGARTNEIGIRMSLGADGARVQRMILREGGLLLALGMAAGIAAAALGARIIDNLLFGVSPHDPATFASVVLLMASIGLLACWLPALRASRIDPAITMRSA